MKGTPISLMHPAISLSGCEIFRQFLDFYGLRRRGMITRRINASLSSSFFVTRLFC